MEDGGRLGSGDLGYMVLVLIFGVKRYAGVLIYIFKLYGFSDSTANCSCCSWRAVEAHDMIRFINIHFWHRIP